MCFYEGKSSAVYLLYAPTSVESETGVSLKSIYVFAEYLVKELLLSLRGTVEQKYMHLSQMGLGYKGHFIWYFMRNWNTLKFLSQKRVRS